MQCDLDYFWLRINDVIPCGSKTFFYASEWCKEYASNYPNPKKLQKEIDEFMEQFDKKQEEVIGSFRHSSSCCIMLCYSVKHQCLNLLMQEKEEAKRLQSEPDDEGWITIGKGGRKPGASKVDASELLEKKKKRQKVGLKGYIKGRWRVKINSQYSIHAEFV